MALIDSGGWRTHGGSPGLRRSHSPRAKRRTVALENAFPMALRPGGLRCLFTRGRAALRQASPGHRGLPMHGFNAPRRQDEKTYRRDRSLQRRRTACARPKEISCGRARPLPIGSQGGLRRTGAARCSEGDVRATGCSHGRLAFGLDGCGGCGRIGVRPSDEAPSKRAVHDWVGGHSGQKAQREAWRHRSSRPGQGGNLPQTSEMFAL
jgi:hypothetical protein